MIVVNSFSKSWSMTGWRLGWLTHPAGPRAGFSPSSTSSTSPRPPPLCSMPAWPRCATASPSVREMVDRYRRNRDLVFQRLAAHAAGDPRRARRARFMPSSPWTGMTDSVAYARTADRRDRRGHGARPRLRRGRRGLAAAVLRGRGLDVLSAWRWTASSRRCS